MHPLTSSSTASHIWRRVRTKMGWTEGQMYSGQEISSMLKDAGFRDIQIHPAFGYFSIVTGHKP